jgi:hypothetical protein
MSDRKHTPGPWKFLVAFGRVEAESRLICSIAASVKEGNLRDAMGNGALIAAAPELLEALEAYVNACEQDIKLGSTTERAIEVIRKAKGEL